MWGCVLDPEPGERFQHFCLVFILLDDQIVIPEPPTDMRDDGFSRLCSVSNSQPAMNKSKRKRLSLDKEVDFLSYLLFSDLNIPSVATSSHAPALPFSTTSTNIWAQRPVSTRGTCNWESEKRTFCFWKQQNERYRCAFVQCFDITAVFLDRNSSLCYVGLWCQGLIVLWFHSVLTCFATILTPVSLRSV